ncbi:MAG: type II restriction endonuclease [Candidatus Cloacimonadota bacterium]|nr:type II restriction endonuclease [Candidatus Cloacimonadota bacterium]
MSNDFQEFQKSIRKRFMPSGKQLSEFAQEKLIIKDVEKNFNSYLRKLLNNEFELYKEYEKKCTLKIFEEAFQRKLFEFPKDNSQKAFLGFFDQHYDDFWKVFLSISQSRKTRAGGSFEKHLRFLFSKINYPYDMQTTLNGRVDYLFPSEEVFKKNRTVCLIISVKRTLRERWRQVIGELSSINAGKIYIATQEENIAKAKIHEMKKHNINLVVFDEEKEKNFLSEYNVIGFTELITVHLPAQKILWEKFI